MAELWPYFKEGRDRIGKERGWGPVTRTAFEREAGPDGSLYVGSPETVGRKIAETARTLGIARFDLKYSNGRMPHNMLMSSIELYGSEVIPRVRELLARHGKNYSFLHEQSGAVRLAPIYDVLSTLYYGDDRLAMYIDDVRRTDRVTTDRILNEANSWGMAREAAGEIVAELLARIPDAVKRALADTPGVPEGITQIVDSQLVRLNTSS